MWYIIPRCFSLLYACVAVYFIVKYASLFAVHPFLMLLAFIVLMAEGIQVFTSPNIWFLTFPRKKKVYVHWIIQAVAGVAVALGFLSIYAQKVTNGKNHFTTWHGTTGVATCVCVGCTVLGGVTNLYKSKLIPVVKPYILNRAHKYFGAVTFILGLITIGIGFMSNWAERELSITQRGVLISFLIPFGISVLYLAAR